MNNKDLYTTVESMKHEDEIVPNNVKIQVLNNLKSKAQDLQRLTLDVVMLNALSSIILVIEDAYNISLYRFQFSLLTNTLTKELKNIEDTIAYMSEAI